MTLYVDFSERVVIDRPELLVARQGGGAACAAAASDLARTSQGELGASCASLDTGEPIEVTVGSGVRGTSGVSLGDSGTQAPRQFTFVPSAQPEWGVGCRRYVPDLWRPDGR